MRSAFAFQGSRFLVAHHAREHTADDVTGHARAAELLQLCIMNLKSLMTWTRDATKYYRIAISRSRDQNKRSNLKTRAKYSVGKCLGSRQARLYSVE